MRTNEQARPAMSHRRTDRTDVAGDDDASTGHRLEHDVWKAVAVARVVLHRGHDDHIRTLVLLGQFVVRFWTAEADAMRDTANCAARDQVLAVGPLADQAEPPGDVDVEPRYRVEQHVKTLLLNQPADGEQPELGRIPPLV